MRLSTKLSLGLTLTSAAILGAYGYRQLRQEEVDLRTAVEHHLQLLATAVQIAAENAFRDQQPADVEEVLESLELKDSSIDVFVFDAAGNATATSYGSASTLPLVREVERRVPKDGSLYTFEGPRGLSHLIAVLPLRGDSGPIIGRVALVRPLDDLRRDLSDTAAATLLSVLTLVVGISAVGALLVMLWVRRPLSALAASMNVVRGGELAPAREAPQDDEVGDVIRGFNAMVAELAAARQRVNEEVDSRQALEAGLKRVDKLVTVGQLAAGLAHEIGSPLQVLNGRARSLAGNQGLPAEARRHAEILVEQSDRIASIVEQLLSYARRKAPRPQRIDLGRPVRSVVDLLAAEARRKGVRIECAFDPAAPAVWADESQVQQVALNLLTNAMRASPDGGVIRVAVGPGTLPANGSPGASLAVEDHGAGMDEATRRRIFEPFFTTWAEAGGTGLGLAVVSSILQEHGGAVAVESRPGEGTRFVATFPAWADQREVA